MAGTVAAVAAGWDDRDVVQTLVIVDDSLEFLASAQTMLNEEGFDVLGCVSDPLQAVDEVRRLRPAVVLVDIQLPSLDGFALAGRLAALEPRPTVILISSREAETYGAQLADAPVRGFISKWELSGDALAAMV